VSPLIEALPCKVGDATGGEPSAAEKLAVDLRLTLINKYFDTVPGLLVSVIDGNNGEAHVQQYLQAVDKTFECLLSSDSRSVETQLSELSQGPSIHCSRILM
jgi:hypothetical protein